MGIGVKSVTMWPGASLRALEIHRMPEPIRVVAAVIERNGKLLVCQRPAHKRHGGLWEFPGGKCEPGESDEQAIQRELLEELAVSTTIVGSELLSVTDDGGEFVIVFMEVEIEGIPKSLEHDALAWAAPAELLLMPLAPSDRRFVQQHISSE